MPSLDAYGRSSSVQSWTSKYWPTALLWILILTMYASYIPSHILALKFPGPADVIRAQGQISWDLLSHATATLIKVLAGLLIGCSSGVLLGLMMFAYPRLSRILSSFIEALRPVPPIALVPFFILWFKLSLFGQLLLISLGCFMVLLVSTYELLSALSVDLRRAAYSLGFRGHQFHFRILLPAIVPQLIGSLRVALGLAFSLAVAAEFMGAQSGLGYLMMVSRRTLHTETILLCAIVIGLEAALADYVLRTLHRRFTIWHH